MVSHVQVEAQSELACKSCHEVSQEVIAPLRQICTKNHVLPMFINPHLRAFRGRWHALTWCWVTPDAPRGSRRVWREAGQLTGSGWGTWAQCSAVVGQDAALSSFLFFRYYAHSEGILKQIMNSTESPRWRCCNTMSKIFFFYVHKSCSR